MHLSPSDPDITTLVRRIENKRLDLQPHFQRGEVWGLPKKQRLIDSIIRGWHIPPIHVIQVPNSTKNEVLDGQQRLAAIRDFVNNEFPFNGTFEPYSSALNKLDGVYYENLEDDYKSIIDEFTIRIITISDYEPGEPGELFYRLNQPTNLTAAEQRNAYFGEARQQVKDLSEFLEEIGFSSKTIGFSNSRMSYDDTIAKVLLTLEYGDLNTKITANVVTQRYRDASGFSVRDISLIKRSSEILIYALENNNSRVKLNKSTLYSWLIFICKALRKHKIEQEDIIGFIIEFEMIRLGETSTISPKITTKTIMALLGIYLDRSSSRVADISSVKLRNFVLWALFSVSNNSANYDMKSLKQYRKSIYYFSSSSTDDLENEISSAMRKIELESYNG